MQGEYSCIAIALQTSSCDCVQVASDLSPPPLVTLHFLSFQLSIFPHGTDWVDCVALCVADLVM